MHDDLGRVVMAWYERSSDCVALLLGATAAASPRGSAIPATRYPLPATRYPLPAIQPIARLQHRQDVLRVRRI